ncbi:hypothetical protein BH23ACT4_BH23ACT4_07710 [soil metagenome]
MENSITQEFLKAELHTLAANGAILRLAGEIDMSTGHIVAEQLEVASKAGWTEFVIDLTKVSFMDSVGLHVLIEGKRLLHESGSAIVLVTSPQIRRLFDLVFPEPIFATRVNSMEEAMRFLGLEENRDDK